MDSLGTIELDEGIRVGKWMVVGYSRELDQPVLSTGGINFTLEQIRRVAWDQGEDDAFTDTELELINQAVAGLKKRYKENPRD